jgi:acetylornithine deacetylase/succinyl-diaminopimelate desuccinylase-like protein
MAPATSAARAPEPGPGFDWAPVQAEALALFQTLLRIDTTNPPGNERAAAHCVADALRADGYDPAVLESLTERANVVARYKGDGSKPPLLLDAHLDVVEADPKTWQHPPFGGEIHDGYVWGRGAVDMKNMVAMSTWVMKLLARTRPKLKRDVIFAATADEEAGSKYGAEYLVAEHRKLVECEYVLGEIGGFSLNFNGVAYYPIQIAQKGILWGRLRVEGPPGHGSMPRPDSAVVRLAEIVARIGRTRLPQHTSAPVRDMFEALAREQKFPVSMILRGLLNPALSGMLLKLIPNPGVARAFSAVLSNTVSPTVLRAGNKVNVIPGQATVEFDGRVVPEKTPDDLIAELKALVGSDVQIEEVDRAPPQVTPQDTDLYAALSAALKRGDPAAIPVPYVIPGFTDARAYVKLGAKYYGFAPLRFDPTHKVSFPEMYHGNDERAPVDGFFWGLRTLYDAVTTFCAQ